MASKCWEHPVAPTLAWIKGFRVIKRELLKRERRRFKSHESYHKIWGPHVLKLGSLTMLDGLLSKARFCAGGSWQFSNWVAENLLILLASFSRVLGHLPPQRNNCRSTYLAHSYKSSCILHNGGWNLLGISLSSHTELCGKAGTRKQLGACFISMWTSNKGHQILSKPEWEERNDKTVGLYNIFNHFQNMSPPPPKAKWI